MDGALDGGMHGGSALGQGLGLMDSMYGPDEHRERRLRFFRDRDPLEDVWVIGGAFLDHFVTMLDFDEARIGFAEPAEDVEELGATSLSELPPSRLVDATEAARPGLFGSACAAVVAFASLGLLVARRSRARGAADESEDAELAALAGLEEPRMTA